MALCKKYHELQWSSRPNRSTLLSLGGWGIQLLTASLAMPLLPPSPCADLKWKRGKGAEGAPSGGPSWHWSVGGWIGAPCNPPPPPPPPALAKKNQIKFPLFPFSSPILKTVPEWNGINCAFLENSSIPWHGVPLWLLLLQPHFDCRCSNDNKKKIYWCQKIALV